ncbi:Activin receptor type-2A [Desmophyllum pertusum]|uniref:Activin receptor type-2A n=1 Tax=Desmophyllum pertusum TaxID=174260 RepID=A0A9X0D8A0_9CNID|nr:Activin receptor type-2A [Desmophyllum pertusum]
MERKLLMLLATIAVQFLLTEGRTCNYYNYRCVGQGCKTVKTCDTDDQKCYSLYVTVHGRPQVLLKGCWKQDNACSQTGCVFRKRDQGPTLFCCCFGDYCNSSSPTQISNQTHAAASGK